MADGSEGTASRKVVRIPSSGAPPGEWRQRAALLGVLEGEEASPGRWCLWMRSAAGNRTPVLWPAGYHACLDPLEVRDAAGQLFARAGEHLVLGGGFRPVDPDDPCSLGQDQAFYVQSETPMRARSWRDYIEAPGASSPSPGSRATPGPPSAGQAPYRPRPGR